MTSALTSAPQVPATTTRRRPFRFMHKTVFTSCTYREASRRNHNRLLRRLSEGTYLGHEGEFTRFEARLRERAYREGKRL